MKVVRPDADTLVVSGSPMASIVAMGVFVVAVGLTARSLASRGQLTWGTVATCVPFALIAIAWPFTVRWTAFRFDRRRDEVERRTRSVFGQTSELFRLADLRAAEVEMQPGIRGRRSSRVRLAFYDATSLPLTRDFPPGPPERAERTAGAINAFLVGN